MILINFEKPDCTCWEKGYFLFDDADIKEEPLCENEG